MLMPRPDVDEAPSLHPAHPPLVHSLVLVPLNALKHLETHRKSIERATHHPWTKFELGAGFNEQELNYASNMKDEGSNGRQSLAEEIHIFPSSNIILGPCALTAIGKACAPFGSAVIMPSGEVWRAPVYDSDGKRAKEYPYLQSIPIALDKTAGGGETRQGYHRCHFESELIITAAHRSSPADEPVEQLQAFMVITGSIELFKLVPRKSFNIEFTSLKCKSYASQAAANYLNQHNLRFSKILLDGHDIRWRTREATPSYFAFLLFTHEKVESPYQIPSTQQKGIIATPNDAEPVSKDSNSSLLEKAQVEPPNHTLHVRKLRYTALGVEPTDEGHDADQDPNPILTSLLHLFHPHKLNPKSSLELIFQWSYYGTLWWRFPFSKATCGLPDIEWPEETLPKARMEFLSSPDSGVHITFPGHSWTPKMDLEISSVWSIPRVRDPKQKRGNLGRFSNFVHLLVFENLPESLDGDGEDDEGGVERVVRGRNVISLTSDELSKEC